MEKYIEQLKPLFAQVADKIGQGAEFGWEIVVRQQLAYGIIALLIGTICVIALCLLICVWKHAIKDGDLVELWIFGLVVVMIGLVWSSIVAILRLMNPAYYALQFFINLVK